MDLFVLLVEHTRFCAHFFVGRLVGQSVGLADKIAAELALLPQTTRTRPVL